MADETGISEMELLSYTVKEIAGNKLHFFTNVIDLGKKQAFKEITRLFLYSHTALGKKKNAIL